MLTTVKIILIVILVGLAALALGAWWIIRKFKAAFKEGLENAPTHPACRLNPEPEPNPQWRNPEQIKQFSDEFVANGFSPLGAFTIPEIGGLQIAPFVNEGERLFGVVYDHKQLPPNLDIVCQYEDGTEFTVTNTTFGSAMDRPPDSGIIRLDGGGVREMLEALRGHTEPSPRLPVKGEEFISRFKTAYAKEMNWRLKRGGSTREEFRRQAEKDGVKLSGEEFEEAYQMHREGYLLELQAGCIAQYLDEQRPPPSKWEEIEHRVFAVPETMTEAEVRAALVMHCNLDEEQVHQLEQIKLAVGQTALDFMKQVAGDNMGGLGLKRLGSVQEPVPAEIYLAQTGENDEPIENGD